MNFVVFVIFISIKPLFMHKTKMIDSSISDKQPLIISYVRIVTKNCEKACGLTMVVKFRVVYILTVRFLWSLILI